MTNKKWHDSVDSMNANIYYSRSSKLLLSSSPKFKKKVVSSATSFGNKKNKCFGTSGGNSKGLLLVVVPIIIVLLSWQQFSLKIIPPQNVEDLSAPSFFENRKNRQHSRHHPLLDDVGRSSSTTGLTKEKELYNSVYHYQNLTMSLRLHPPSQPAVLHFVSYFDSSTDLKLELDALQGTQGLHVVQDVRASMLYPNISWVGSLRNRRPCNDEWIQQATKFYHQQQKQQLEQQKWYQDSSSNRRQRRRKQQHEQQLNTSSPNMMIGYTNSNHNYKTSNMIRKAYGAEFYIKPDWIIHLTDWYDSPKELLRCVRLEKRIGIDKFQYWKRSVVDGRHWDNYTQSIVLGHVITNISDIAVQFLAYPVRSDLALAIALVANIQVHWNIPNNITHIILSSNMTMEMMMNITTTSNNNNSNNNNSHLMTNFIMNASTLTNYLVTKDRPGDVAHYWPPAGNKVSRGSRFGSNSQYRTLASEALLSMQLPPYNVTNVFCDLQGHSGNRGRNTLSIIYAESMLQYKIIVVVQRDSWEGHWRLMEAMISGAMVIHDRMLAVPYGLEENVNIVIFDTIQELKEKVMYYLTHTEERLTIARRGRQAAMCYHRSWHRMEQIVTGRPITACHE